nr:putative aldehyde dehydrogenase-like protein [Quercus suber]
MASSSEHFRPSTKKKAVRLHLGFAHVHRVLLALWLPNRQDMYGFVNLLQSDATISLLGSILLGSITIWGIYRFVYPDPTKAVVFTVPAPDQCKPGWRGSILQSPTIKVPNSTVIQCYAPATGADLGFINPSTPSGIDRAIQKATAAQLKWAQSSFIERKRVLRSLLTFVLEHQESIVRAACLDSGKTRVDAIFGEVLVTVEKLKWTLDHGEAALRPDRRPGNLLMFYKKNQVYYEPLGVVSACVSWK